MQQEIRFATFNVCNLAPPGMTFYDNLPAHTQEEYDAKTSWIAQQLDLLDADVVAFQEIFSQAALQEVLAKTRNYRQAHHAGIDPDSDIFPLTPSVALVSRLPLAGEPMLFGGLPPELSGKLPQGDVGMMRFTRPVLQVPIRISDSLYVNVLVVHLKSKRPDFHAGEDETDPSLFGLASLRSLYRRGAEALGLRLLINGFMQENAPAPLIVMGDFNDTADAVTTQLVMGIGRYGEDSFGHRLFDSYRIQACRNLSRDVSFSHMHDGVFNTIDHVLVSKEFHPDYPQARAQIQEVIYMNDHVLLRRPEASDHGIVLVRIGFPG
jgi:endonuclease/exonuclease/phosphatase family metal-dependent hydrolase